MVGHKTRLNKLKKTEIISSIFSDHNGLKLETNLKEKTQKHSNTWQANNKLLKTEWVNTEIKEEIKKDLETNANGHTTIQNLWDTAKAVLWGKFTAIQAYLIKIETFQENVTLHLQELEGKKRERETRPK